MNERIDIRTGSGAVAFEALDLCAAALVVYHEALGLPVACKGAGGPLSFVSPMDSPERAIAAFTRLLETAGAVVYMERGTVVVEGVAAEGGAVDTPQGVVQGVDFSGERDRISAGSFDQSSAHLPGVPPEAVAALGFPSIRVFPASGGSVIFGRASQVSLVSQLASPLATDVLSIVVDAPGVDFPLPEGVQMTSDDETGRVSIIGPRAGMIAVARLIEPFMGARQNIAADVHLVVTAAKLRGGFSMLPRTASAVASAGRSATVAVPGGVVASGSQLKLTTGQSVPFDQRRDDKGNVEYGYRDSGLILSVLPTYRADGLIRAAVTVEMSDATEGSRPTFTQTVATSVVNVTSGQSVLVGSIQMKARELVGALGVLPVGLDFSASDETVSVEVFLRLAAVGVQGVQLHRGAGK